MDWRQAVVLVIGVVALGVLGSGVLRLYSRRSPDQAIVRRADALESALVSGKPRPYAKAFDGWSYRVTARFAGRVRIVISDTAVSVAGPRVPSWVYWSWIWVQTLLLALVFPAVAASIVFLDWRWLAIAVGAFVLSFIVSMGGAGMWPGLGELAADQGEGHLTALELPRSSVREVDIGSGWAKGGFEVVLFPYVAGVNRMSAGRAVSFFAPDETGREVRLAIDVYTPQAAAELAALLRQPASVPPA